MTKERFILFHLSLIAVSALVIYYLFPNNHSAGGLSLPLNKSEIEHRANLFLETIDLDAAGFIPDAVLRSDREMMRQLHYESGVDGGNAAIRGGIPVFYWDIRYLKDENWFDGVYTNICPGYRGG